MEVDDPSRFAEKFKVDSSRKTNWDYTSPGIYFITICAVHHNKFFGKIIDNKMVLSPMGIIANEELLNTFKLRKNILLHEYIIMPNHVHVLMEILGNKIQQSIGKEVSNVGRDVLQNVSTIKNINVSTMKEKSNHSIRIISESEKIYFSNISPKSNSVSNIIKMYKSSVTRIINPKTVFFGWQTRFHDEIIKDEKQLIATKIYIKNNPKNWQKDEFNK